VRTDVVARLDRPPLLSGGEAERLIGHIRPVRRGRWACWEWAGKRDRFGYGRVWLRGHWHTAHRVAFTHLALNAAEPRVARRRRSIPSSEPWLDHRCNNESRVRPSHLRPVTNAENQRLRVLRGDYSTKPSLVRAA